MARMHVDSCREYEKNVDLQHHMEQGMNGLHGNRWILQNRQALVISRLKKIDRVVPSFSQWPPYHLQKSFFET